MRKIGFIVGLLVMSSALGLAQGNIDFGMFNDQGELRSIYKMSNRLSEDWTFNFDAGNYTGMGNNTWTRWGIRGNVNRKLSSRYAVETGLMFNHINGLNNRKSEYRMQQAFYVSYPRLRGSNVKHRLQMDERWFHTMGQGSNLFKSRIRYRLSHNGRLDGKPVHPHGFYYRTSAEVFFNLQNETKDGLFMRGRYSCGYGYQFSKELGLDLAYTYEHTHISCDVPQNINHIFWVNIRQKIDWRLH